MDTPTLLLTLVFPRAECGEGDWRPAGLALVGGAPAELQGSERQRDKMGLMQSGGMWGWVGVCGNGVKQGGVRQESSEGERASKMEWGLLCL